MKRLLSFIFSFLMAITLFAETSTYSSLMEKAKAYEVKGEWAYAMGFYADAMAAEPLNCADAYKRYNEIVTSIESGVPGIGKYNGIKFFNGWKNLLINVEKYWTEYCPYDIYISNLEVKNVYKTTADYGADVRIERSKKYVDMIKTIVTGYSKVRDDAWDLPKVRYDEYSTEYYIFLGGDYWPYISVSKPGDLTINSTAYPIVKTASNYNNNGVVTYSAMPNYDGSWDKKGNYVYKETSLVNYYNSFAFLGAPSISSYNLSGYSLYDLKIKIVDSDGKDFVAGKRVLPQFDSYNKQNDTVLFSGLTMKQAEAIDDGKAFPVLEGIYLQYGFQSYNDAQKFYSDKNKTSFKTNLAEKTVDVSKANVIYDYKDETINSYKNAIFFNKYKSSFDEAISKMIVTESEDSISYVINYDQGFYFYSKDGNVSYYNGDYNIDINGVKGYDLANYLSLYTGSTPCYDNKGNKIEGTGFYFKEISFDGYERELYKVKTISAEEKQKIKDELTAELSVYKDKLDVINKVINYNLDSNYYFDSIPDYIQNAENNILLAKNNDARESLASIKKYCTKEELIEYESKVNKIDADLEKGKTVYAEKKAKYDELLPQIKGFQPYSNEFNSVKSKLDSLSKYYDSNKSVNYSNLNSILKDVEQIDFTLYEKALKDLQALTEEATEFYNQKSALYTELKEGLKSVKTFDSQLKTFDANLKKLNSAITGRNTDTIKSSMKEIEKTDIVSMQNEIKRIKDEEERRIREEEARIAAEKALADEVIAELDSLEKDFLNLKNYYETVFSNVVNPYKSDITTTEEEIKSIRSKFASLTNAQIGAFKGKIVLSKYKTMLDDSAAWKDLMPSYQKLEEKLKSFGITGKYQLYYIDGNCEFVITSVEKKSIAESAKLKQDDVLKIDLKSSYDLIMNAKKGEKIELSYSRNDKLSKTTLKIK